MEQQAQAVGTAREMQERREAWSSYRQHQAAWLNACMQALQGALQPAKAAAAAPVPQRGALQFELLSDDVVENKILASRMARSEEHTSELQSQSNLVCRLLLEKKKKINITTTHVL